MTSLPTAAKNCCHVRTHPPPLPPVLKIHILARGRWKFSPWGEVARNTLELKRCRRSGGSYPERESWIEVTFWAGTWSHILVRIRGVRMKWSTSDAVHVPAKKYLLPPPNFVAVAW